MFLIFFYILLQWFQYDQKNNIEEREKMMYIYIY